MLDGRKMTFDVVRIADRSWARQIVCEVRNVQAASDTMLAWPDRGTKWHKATEVLSDALVWPCWR